MSIINQLDRQSRQNYRFIANEFDKLNIWIVSVNLPGVDLPEVKVPGRMGTFSAPGDRMTFSPLTMEYNVDEGIGTYLEIFNWMHGTVNPADLDGDLTKTTTANLFINSNKNNILTIIRFFDLHPTQLSDLQLDNRDTAVFVGNVTFSYSYFEIAQEPL